MTRIYRGHAPGPHPSAWRVEITEPGKPDRALDPCTDVANHSSSGFSWGFQGSGPAQLALALLCDAVGVRRALPLYQAFKRQRIARLEQYVGWRMTQAEVVQWVQEAENSPPEAA
jgi:uncharacterized protein DUF6166